MSWSIHNLASPAVQTDARGTYTHDGANRIPAPTPLHVAETRDEAEAWRAEMAWKIADAVNRAA